jgi:hypothetical protein
MKFKHNSREYQTIADVTSIANSLIVKRSGV